MITPPDILDNTKSSVLIINPAKNDLELILKFLQFSKKTFNLYLYYSNMNNKDWLDKVTLIAENILINSDFDQNDSNYDNLILLDKTYYYGGKSYLENYRKLNEPMEYFLL